MSVWRRQWRWVRFGWTALFGYHTPGGNRLRIFVGASGDKYVAISFRDEPSASDMIAVAKFLADWPARVERIGEQKQQVYE